LYRRGARRTPSPSVVRGTSLGFSAKREASRAYAAAMADSKGDSTKTALLLDDFVTSLRRRKVEGSLDTAKRTALLMRHVIADARTPNPADLIAAVRAAGMRLVEACRTGACAAAAARAAAAHAAAAADAAQPLARTI
jgi:hypothetical protein